MSINENMGRLYEIRAAVGSMYTSLCEMSDSLDKIVSKAESPSNKIRNLSAIGGFIAGGITGVILGNKISEDNPAVPVAIGTSIGIGGAMASSSVAHYLQSKHNNKILEEVIVLQTRLKRLKDEVFTITTKNTGEFDDDEITDDTITIIEENLDEFKQKLESFKLDIDKLL